MNTFFQDTFGPQKKTIITIIIAVGVLLALFLLTATFAKMKEYRFIGSEITASNTITATGFGKIERAPDTAKISFSVQQESANVKTAQTIVNDKMKAITKALSEAGIEEKNIKTDTYTSYPQYNYTTVRCIASSCPRPGTPTIRGYQVAHTVTVSIKDLEKVDTVLGILGSNNVSDLNGPNLGFEDDKAVAREARDLAIEDAREEAKKLARALGVDLVRIVSFNEEGSGGIVPQYDRAMAVGATSSEKSTLSIPVGTQNIQSTVSVVYEIR